MSTSTGAKDEEDSSVTMQSGTARAEADGVAAERLAETESPAKPRSATSTVANWLAFIVAAAVMRLAGSALALFFLIALLVVGRVRRPSDGPLQIAFALQFGLLCSFVLAVALGVATAGAVAVDVAILTVGLVWLFLKEGIAPLIILSAYETLSIVVGVVQLSSRPEADGATALAVLTIIRVVVVGTMLHALPRTYRLQKDRKAREGTQRALASLLSSYSFQPTRFALSAAVVATVAFAVFVWPTRFRYDEMSVKGNRLPVRIDRLTGRTDILWPEGWRSADDQEAGHAVAQVPSSTPTTPPVLPAAELSKVTGHAGIDGSFFKASVYNGSSIELHTVVFRVKVFENDQQVLVRDYRILPELGFCLPLTTCNFLEELDFTMAPTQEMKWGILSAEPLAR